MQPVNNGLDGTDESVLKEMHLVIQAAGAEADMAQYSLETGSIVLSVPEELSIEAMYCTGRVLPDKKPACAAVCLQEFDAEVPERYADSPGKPDLTYGFFSARYADTVISECAVYLSHTESEEYLPIRILSAKMIFEDRRELDYSEKISACVIRNLAGTA